ncbi:malonyl-CoA decarboxylase [Hypericibacter terrae]|uniref:Malonyl-CoA decarboxylase n=1 Tax=Hypericibacter terrae TaxID=2602015 RepID=A0A5J6MQJ5_9PROT|nr:malonyl-CoA decarboxylase [Hypericibacter terrae]QEX19387.1 malonyl-CoA decarboxylase [Hypericibacter terrae]
MTAPLIGGILDQIIEAGRRLLSQQSSPAAPGAGLDALCARVLAQRGEATALAAASELAARLERLTPAEETKFFRTLATRFGADREKILAAAEAYRREDSPAHLHQLGEAVEAPRQELLRRLNMAPGGTRAIVSLRERLLGRLAEDPALRAVDADFQHLLGSWFNRGFLYLERIDWNSPASLLEKIKRYESVHEIANWSDLRRRLAPDRRCFAFFHPALKDEPLIFIEVALGRELASSIQPIIDPDASALDPATATHAIFFSINNSLNGLRGISFGNFLIKQVVVELQRELPQLKTFATLSPIPSLRGWLGPALADAAGLDLDPAERQALSALQQKPSVDATDLAPLRDSLTGLCARYLGGVLGGPRPADPVARFHLGNGARLERINWLGDVSPKGLQQSFGMLVNYYYDLDNLELNHEAFAEAGKVALSKELARLIAAKPRPKARPNDRTPAIVTGS